MGDGAATPLATTEDKSTFLDYGNNETASKEPVSNQGNVGKRSSNCESVHVELLLTTREVNPTQSSPNANDDFLKLNPVLDGPQSSSKSQSSGEPKIYTSRDDPTYAGMPIVPLNPDVATSGVGTTSSTPSAIGTSTIATKTGTTDKVWKDTPLDDISRSGAPGAGPPAPAHVTPAVPETASSGTGSAVISPDPTIKTTAPDSVTAASNTYSSDPPSLASTPVVSDSKTSKTSSENTAPQPTPQRDGTPAWTDTGVPSKVDPSTLSDAGAPKGLLMTTGQMLSCANGDTGVQVTEEKRGRQSETGKSPATPTSPGGDEKSGKMSHLKEKLKDKLHIGSKDK